MGKKELNTSDREHNLQQTAPHVEIEEADRLAMREECAHYLDPPGPSVIASRVRSLKSSVFSVAERRERLPQQLFWSLFHSEIDEIKRSKARRRVLDMLS